ncbi:MAG: ribosome maturation factor RimP [Limnochordia bacterium]|jgi:ribosome maturation factor RimP|nr:ribosome maturation factor RimP [Limnochordia bacterium]MDD2629777.1 ribosome maturation factor RimP [Limnochordia bacterium]MDD4518007.1 ribosome maturation factor RimP [Limnochordia bacterium]
MKAKDIVALVEELFAEVIDPQYELVDVEFGSGRNGAALRVYVDKEGGITVDDCQDISTILGPRLDERDPIATPYEFEVSSPGLERPLRKLEHFQKVVGSQIRVRTYGPIDGRKNFKGELVEIDDTVLKMSIDGKLYSVPFKQVSKANLVYEF